MCPQVEGPPEEGRSHRSFGDQLVGCLGGSEGPAQTEAWNVGERVTASPKAGLEGLC